jgi:tetratricopeptide (TPR) repeat protein
VRVPALAIALVLASNQVALAQGPKKAPAAPAPPPEPTPAARAATFASDGNQAMLTMRYADALSAYQKALELAPEDVGLYYSVARAEEFLGDFPAALAALEAFDARATPESKARVGKLDDLFAELRPRVATLDLTCSQAGARVLVRDKVVGATPLPPTRLAAGASTVQLELEGFFTEKRDVVLPGGGTLKLDVPLHPRSSAGLLNVSSDPTGARVVVDGKELGTASPALEVALAAGSHVLTASHDGYDDAKLALVMAPGATRDVTVALEPSRSIFTRWYFWTAVGVAVAGGVALTYALTTEKGADRGTLSPGQVGGP